MEKDHRLFLYDCKDGVTRPFKVPKSYFDELVDFGYAFMDETLFYIEDDLTNEVRTIKGSLVHRIVKNGYELK